MPSSYLPELWGQKPVKGTRTVLNLVTERGGLDFEEQNKLGWDFWSPYCLSWRKKEERLPAGRDDYMGLTAGRLVPPKESIRGVPSEAGEWMRWSLEVAQSRIIPPDTIRNCVTQPRPLLHPGKVEMNAITTG